jgi:metal-responsive CopG/Arc/MetJ family transcriptional regulator
MAERSTKVVSVSLPPESAAAFDRLSAAEGHNRSELFREMLRVYEAYRETGRFETLQRYGASRARAAGVTSEDDVQRLLGELRGS